ncbi:hypothetical protein BDS110ZK25_74150 [Bradyrhizobium diazoefficiens]|uniref:Uncharacterized protein n=1 Tax=Bradyrhizobium diazoefficiens TaxID=1355477 RepID=A0A809ZD46_9BRAD|nr:hypothetical protein F07S3_60610 [Bradyrhizobium diazoefficiens]BCA05257.1 hypothetical protein H12S4_61610 [Bradyrhizobium diazoefficiens]BCA13913.1 hypothetical protein BDHF08_57600 [Bradyrhizobium diazoefficiens]BCA22612.1 hypothetical protein BDHH15_58270 [Bradyrhizobium diazoefficiens]BCE23274.1 hypothetical protein XF1B_59550 [Bradyrhizobium diazoefficiens]
MANADFARKPSNAAGGVNGSLKAIITHVDLPSKSRVLILLLLQSARRSVIPAQRRVNRIT